MVSYKGNKQDPTTVVLVSAALHVTFRLSHHLSIRAFGDAVMSVLSLKTSEKFKTVIEREYRRPDVTEKMNLRDPSPRAGWDDKDTARLHTFSPLVIDVTASRIQAMLDATRLRGVGPKKVSFIRRHSNAWVDRGFAFRRRASR